MLLSAFAIMNGAVHRKRISYRGRQATSEPGAAMKLIIQIPCFNEEATLLQTLIDLPRQIDGVDEIETLIIDDGSSDATVRVAREWGVDHLVRHRRNRGLAAAFASGFDACLQLGADLIVNTDGDNQYPGDAIPRLIAPILKNEADIAIGDRQTWKCKHFSLVKRLLEKLGSRVVSGLAGCPVPDAVSGFRAFSREAALKLNVVTSFSYTIETVLQATSHGLAIANIPINANSGTRKSRLFKSIPHFLLRSGVTMLRVYAMYHSLTIFVWPSFLLMILGAAPIARFMYLFAIGEGGGHIQSLVLGGVLFLCGCIAFAFGILADMLAANRRLLEMTLEKLRRNEVTMEVPSISRALITRNELIASTPDFSRATQTLLENHL